MVLLTTVKSMVYKMNKAIILSGLLLANSMSWAATQAEGEFYRYTDELGNTAIARVIPTNRIAFGYDILNGSGRVIRSIDRELTDKERASRSQKSKQEAYDLGLLRRYSFVSDIESEKTRKILEMTVRTTILSNNLKRVRSNLSVEYGRAAKQEKSGRKVNKVTQKRIDELEDQIRVTEKLLSKHDEDIEATRKEYLYAIDRFKAVQAILKGSRSHLTRG